jgi:hypothetical protein
MRSTLTPWCAPGIGDLPPAHAFHRNFHHRGWRRSEKPHEEHRMAKHRKCHDADQTQGRDQNERCEAAPVSPRCYAPRDGHSILPCWQRKPAGTG